MCASRKKKEQKKKSIATLFFFNEQEKGGDSANENPLTTCWRVICLRSPYLFFPPFFSMVLFLTRVCATDTCHALIHSRTIIA